MAKVLMKRIFICGPKTKRKAALEFLQRSGAVEINVGDIKDQDLEHMDVSREAGQFLNAAKQADNAVEILNKFAPDKSGGIFGALEGPADMDKASYNEQVDHVNEYLSTASKIVDLNREIIESKAAIPKYQTNIDTLGAWKNLDIPLSSAGTAKSRIFIGSLAEQITVDAIYQRICEACEGTDAPELEVSVISSSETMTAFVAVSHVDDAARVEAALKQIEFVRAPFSTRVPAEEIKSIEKDIADCEASITNCTEEIKKLASERKNVMFAADYYRMRYDKYEVIRSLPQSRNVFFISGYIADKTSAKVVKKLESMECVAEVTDVLPDDDVPCEFQNGFLVDPMESVVESYAYPGKKEFDPSPITACFYYIMFGMMLSDAGYGLVLTLGCGLALLKVKNMKPGMKKMLKLMFFSGIATTFWGFMFGSFFGDAIHVIAATFFNRPDIALKPLWFDPLSQPMRLLVFAFLIGIIHLMTGLTIKLVTLIKNGQVKDAIYDVVFWYMFVLGGIIFLLTQDMMRSMLGLTFTLGQGVGKAALIVMGLGALGVVLTGGRDSKNPVARFLQGLYSAYGITSYLSDILSYSRLLALGLATGCIAQVFNQMGSMAGGGIVGAILFIVIFIVGHVLNLAINVLGAYVHTNRLQFVEFFGKFYEGGGRKFAPFAENNKFYNIKEEY